MCLGNTWDSKHAFATGSRLLFAAMGHPTIIYHSYLISISSINFVFYLSVLNCT